MGTLKIGSAKNMVGVTIDPRTVLFNENNVKYIKSGLTEIWSNVKAYMAEDEVLQLYVRSSVGIKKGLMLKNTVGIVDSDYYSNKNNDGNIGLNLYNTTDEAVVIERGERVVQGIFMKYLTVDNDTFLKDERTGGIGSTNVTNK